MDRRTFLGTAAANLIDLPLQAMAQQTAKVRRLGYLTNGDEAKDDWRPAIQGPLRDLGWIEGKNLVVEDRYAGYKVERLPVLAAELVRLRVELIMTLGTAASLAAKNATATIPIVMLSAGDPVGSGLVASLAHPGGNVTGLSIATTELRLKRLELLHELLPAARRVGELVDPRDTVWDIGHDEYLGAYRRLGIEPIFIEVSSISQLENAVAEVMRQQGQALIVNGDPLFAAHNVQLVTAALRHALPTVVAYPRDVEAGALVSYNASIEGIGPRIAVFIDKILKGARPADLPVTQPTKFVLWINLRTAKMLGLTIPQSLLLRADKVIE